MSPTRTILRGLTKRCPSCGSGGLFTGWFRIVDRCPGCAMRLSREEGAFLGAWFLNITVTQLALLAYLAVAFLLTLPEPPVLPVLAGAVVVCIGMPILGYPFSKTVWAAIHLLMEPLDEAEQADAAVHRFERGDARL